MPSCFAVMLFPHEITEPKPKNSTKWVLRISFPIVRVWVNTE